MFLLATFGLLLTLRLPSIVYNSEINPDESQMITQALTLRVDPVYFRSVDGTTGGPINSYFLILPALIGLPFDYITAHLTAFVLLVVGLWLFFQTAQTWCGETPARLALLPVVFMLGLTQNGDYLHYNSELIPLVLLGWSILLYAALLKESRPPLWRLALIGLLLGMVPYSKLQGVPIAAVIGLFTALAILAMRELPTRQKVTRLSVLVLGGLAFSLFCVALTWLNGVYDDLITFYIVGNLQYGSGSDHLLSITRLPQFFRKGETFDWFVKLVLAVAVVAVGMAWRGPGVMLTATWQRTGFVVALIVAALFSITRTGSEYVHQLFFLIGPLLLLLARAWAVLLQSYSQNQYRWWPIGLLGAYLAVFGVSVSARLRQGQPLNPYVSEGQGGWVVQQTPISKEIVKYAKPGEKLVVWGWRCDYYVQTQMPQGVAENHSIRSAFKHPLQAIYQERYVRDIMRSKPPVFIDAVGQNNLWLTDRSRHGYEMIVSLRRYVDAHYTYMGMVSDSRIFVRNDRVNAQSLTAVY